jgi:hypothetical protein
MIHEFQHILGLCNDSPSHIDIIDIIQYYFSSDIRIIYTIIKYDIKLIFRIILTLFKSL